MIPTRFVLLLALMPLAVQACGTVRVAYSDQERPPYYFGSGNALPARPGASPDLMREMLESIGCKVEFQRMPIPRLRVALSQGQIDAAPIAASGDDHLHFAFPLNTEGRPDPNRALRTMVVLIVRAGDKVAVDADPAVFLKSRRIGAIHGSPFIGSMRKSGLAVDDGAVDLARNLDKLRRGRIDVFALGITAIDEADAFLAKYPQEFRRLRGTIGESHVWLAFNKEWAVSHSQQAEQVWNWVGERGRSRFSVLVREYQKR